MFFLPHIAERGCLKVLKSRRRSHSCKTAIVLCVPIMMSLHARLEDRRSHWMDPRLFWYINGIGAGDCSEEDEATAEFIYTTGGSLLSAHNEISVCF